MDYFVVAANATASCIGGSVRMILFIGCLLQVLLQIIWLAILVIYLTPFNPDFPSSFFSIKIFVYAIVLLLLSVFGCLSSFYALYSCIRAVSRTITITSNLYDLPNYLTSHFFAQQVLSNISCDNNFTYYYNCFNFRSKHNRSRE